MEVTMITPRMRRWQRALDSYVRVEMAEETRTPSEDEVLESGPGSLGRLPDARDRDNAGGQDAQEKRSA